jgi:hypothetical protein
MSSQRYLKDQQPAGPEQPSRETGLRRTGRDRAGSRRWWAAVTAVVAVLAVVAAAFLVGRLRGDNGGSTGTPTSSAPTSSLTTTGPTSASPSGGTSPTTHQPPAGVLDVTALPTGAAPAIGYLDHGVARLPDGTSVQPGTQARAVRFVSLADDSIAYLTQRGSTMAVEVVTADGVHHGPYRSGYELAVNADHSLVAWLTPRGVPTVWQSGQSEPVSFPTVVPGDSRRMAAVTGDDATTADGCRLYLSSWLGNTPRAWVATPGGTLSRADALHRLVAVRAATESGLLVGYLRITDTGSTSGVIDEATAGHPLLWQTSRHTLDGFSPGQRYLLAGPAYRDGLGDGQIAIYSSTGKLLVQRQVPGRVPGFVSGAAWEDATHVLFTIHQDGRWSVVRMGVDGRMEYAVAPVAARWDHAPFQLEVTP